MENEYISKINNLANECTDISLLDLVFQILNKSVRKDCA